MYELLFHCEQCGRRNKETLHLVVSVQSDDIQKIRNLVEEDKLDTTLYDNIV